MKLFHAALGLKILHATNLHAEIVKIIINVKDRRNCIGVKKGAVLWKLWMTVLALEVQLELLISFCLRTSMQGNTPEEKQQKWLYNGRSFFSSSLEFETKTITAKIITQDSSEL